MKCCLTQSLRNATVDKNLRGYPEESETATAEEAHDAKTAKAARDAARVWTLNTLLRVGPEQKRTLVQFLYEAKLTDKDEPVVGLDGADLREASLREADLRDANLYRADLSGADLTRINLGRAILTWTDLAEAHLDMVDLRGAALREANLSGATYNNATTWPDDFDPEAAGVINVDEDDTDE